MVHALARAGGGAKLPSVGLCLNASKAVSRLVTVLRQRYFLEPPRVERLNIMLQILFALLGK